MHRPAPSAVVFAVLAVLAGAAVLAGCASKATMDARYQASLQRWRGATRTELEAAWGQPQLAQPTPDGQVLTWIVRTDVDDRGGPNTPPAVVVTRSPTLGGGPATSVVMGSPMVPAQVPVTCTTHFVLKDGRVASWTFEGLGCGAPT